MASAIPNSTSSHIRRSFAERRCHPGGRPQRRGGTGPRMTVGARGNGGGTSASVLPLSRGQAAGGRRCGDVVDQHGRGELALAAVLVGNVHGQLRLLGAV